MEASDRPPGAPGALPRPEEPDTAPTSGPSESDSPQLNQTHWRWLWATVLLSSAAVGSALADLFADSGLGPRVWIPVLALAGAAFLKAARSDEFTLAWASSRRAAVGVLGVGVAATVGVFVVQVSLLPPTPLARMTGTSDVAIVGFTPPANQDESAYLDAADSLADELATGHKGQALSYARDVGPLPDFRQAGTEEVELWSADFISQTGADLVLGGYASEEDAGRSRLHVLVYVPATQVEDAVELQGWFPLTQVPLERGLDSAAERARVVRAVGSSLKALSGFTTGLDLWHSHEYDDALDQFTRVSESPDGAIGSLGTLFAAHSTQAMAMTYSASEARMRLLDEAARLYASVGDDVGISSRIELSQAVNRYLVEVSSGGCRPDTSEEGLAALRGIVADLSQLSRDQDLSEIQRLKAISNWALAELCLADASAATDREELAGLIEDLKAPARDIDQDYPADRQRANFASTGFALESFEFKRLGQLDRAVISMREAISLQADVARRGAWRAFISLWLAPLDAQREEAAAVAAAAACEFDDWVAGTNSPELQELREAYASSILNQIEDVLGSVQCEL